MKVISKILIRLFLRLMKNMYASTMRYYGWAWHYLIVNISISLAMNLEAFRGQSYITCCRWFAQCVTYR